MIVYRTCVHHGYGKFYKSLKNYRLKDGSKAYKHSCAKCQVSGLRRMRNRFRKDLVEYMGGKCVLCGYSKYIGALDCHHVIRGAKTSNKFLDNVKHRRFEAALPKIQDELSMCILICSNCHREIHGTI